MSREFKVENCWKGRKICRKMYLIEQKSCNLLTQIGKEKKKLRTNVGEWKCKIGALLHFIGKNMRKKCFSKKLKVTGIKCRDKWDNDLSLEKKVAKDTRFNSQQLIFVIFPSCEFSSFKHGTKFHALRYLWVGWIYYLRVGYNPTWSLIL